MNAAHKRGPSEETRAKRLEKILMGLVRLVRLVQTNRATNRATSAKRERETPNAEGHN